MGYRNSFIEYEYGKDVLYEEGYYNEDSVPDIPEGYMDFLAESFERTYGSPLDTSVPKADDVTSIQPNTEYRDENGDNICGATTLYSL